MRVYWASSDDKMVTQFYFDDPSFVSQSDSNALDKHMHKCYFKVIMQLQRIKLNDGVLGLFCAHYLG